MHERTYWQCQQLQRRVERLSCLLCAAATGEAKEVKQVGGRIRRRSKYAEGEEVKAAAAEEEEEEEEDDDDDDDDDDDTGLMASINTCMREKT